MTPTKSSRDTTVATVVFAGCRSDGVGKNKRVRRTNQNDDANDESDVTELRDEKCLDRCSLRIPLFPVLSDQQVGAQAHDLPTDDEEQQIPGDDDGQHCRGEKGDKGRGSWRTSARLACRSPSRSAPAGPRS